ncbi:MAG: signal peptidase II [Tannerellaceae bacterium]|nr:signal peptidase II [Tannerellaceae bacterium]
MEVNRRNIIIAVSGLVLVDMLIKVIIHFYFMDTHFDILPPWFYFQPTYNTHYFYLGSIMGWQIPYWIIFTISLCILVLFYFLYEYYCVIYKNSKWITAAFSVGFAGIICAILSNVFFPGCPDYIYFKPYYTSDLKDVYLNVFAGLLFIALFLNRKTMTTLSFRNYLKSRFKG